MSLEEKRERLAARLKRVAASNHPIPLSSAQQRLWFLDQFQPNSSLYNVPVAVQLTGTLDAAALEQSFQSLIARHEILRTRFPRQDEFPAQIINPIGNSTLHTVDLTHLSDSERGPEAERLIRAEAVRPFELGGSPPLLRATLLRLGETEHRLLINLHHIIADEWSLKILFHELADFYQAAVRGSQPSLPDLPIQYADYAEWQQEWLRGEAAARQLEFWQRQLCDLPPVTELPIDQPRSPTPTFRGASATRLFPAELADALGQLARRKEATLFMTMLAGVNTLVHRYMGQDDVIVLSPIAGRNRLETEGPIGCFVNTLPLRTSLAGDPTFEELLDRVRAVTLEAYAQQDLPFDKLVAASRPDRSPGHLPFSRVMFSVQDSLPEPISLPGLRFDFNEVETGTAKFETTFILRQTAQGLLARVEYNVDLFDAQTISRLLANFETLLGGIVSNPGQRLSELPLLSLPERQQVLEDWNRTTTPYPRDKCIQELFFERVKLSPEATAVSYGAESLSYGELEARAERVARKLKQGGVGVSPHSFRGSGGRSGGKRCRTDPDACPTDENAPAGESKSKRENAPIAICVERGPAMVVGMLAILKAGHPYLPLDPTYPPARLEFMLRDSGCSVLLTQRHLLERLPQSPIRMICIDAVQEDLGLGKIPSSTEAVERRRAGAGSVLASSAEMEGEVAENGAGLVPALGPESPAYIMYTSGSTGRPKGVVVPHRAVVRLVRETNYIRFGPTERVAQVSNISFDAATFEIWGALLNGGQLVELENDVILSPPDFARELRERGITAMFLTAALFNQVVSENPGAFESVRTLIVGGEALDPRSVRAVLHSRPPARLLNGYGPTENTTFTCCHVIHGLPEEATNVPIGRPISNTRVYVLDARRKPVPIGVPGELYAGGEGLALGYWNRADLDAEKFVPNPFVEGERLYRTGDRVRWRAEGVLEFLGRMDDQVKIRGFRIEPGEIEAVLNRHPGVRHSVVTSRNGVGQPKRLVAYFVARRWRNSNDSRLRRFLRRELPDYMVPSVFVRLDALPMTPNGKVDRRALPEPGGSRPRLEQGCATPRDAVEIQLREIWEKVLDVRPIGIEDGFFELGGHSLLALRLLAQIEKAFGRRLPLTSIFKAPTIEQMAAVIREGSGSDAVSQRNLLVEIQSEGSRLPLFLVHGAGGGMFWGYVNLSRRLGSEQPVYGLRPRGLDGPNEVETIEEMAASYVAEIRERQPQGPYHLGGYCFGGNVAFEMARQLLEQGEEVALLALMNCAPPNSSYNRIHYSPLWAWRFARNLFFCANSFLRLPRAQRTAFFRWKFRLWMGQARRGFGRDEGASPRADMEALVDLATFSPEERELWEAHLRALMKYHPRSFPGHVHLFRSSGHPMVCSFAADYGWSEFALGGVTVVKVPGAHEGILDEPCVAVLAQALNRHLAQSSHPTPLSVSENRLQDAASASADGIATAPLHPEQRQLLVEWNRTYAQFPLDTIYPRHFEAQVARTPNAVAIRYRGEELTYDALNRRANHLAHHLQGLGIGPDVLVAVCLDRSLDLGVALLAVLKAGGAYVPLDPAYPPERLEYMLSDSKARVLVTQLRFQHSLSTLACEAVCLDDPRQNSCIECASDTAPATDAGPDNLAYLIYTSGSTGLPKGVPIAHRSLLNHNFAIRRTYGLKAADRVLQFSPISFDISIEELFPSLLAGCAVVLRTDDALSSTRQFFEFIRSEQLSVLNLPTAYWHELVEALQPDSLPPSVRLVIIGGEKASDASFHRWREKVGDAITLINAYGPTEATITATCHIVKPGEQSLTIGRPIANMCALVLDSELKPAPIGVAGELCLGGAGVARGYFNRPELTAERFVPNPLQAVVPCERLYRTGDLVRYRADGMLEFIGRCDQQVKLRGFRIELGEIETALRAHAAIKDAAVLAREDERGRKRLVAYFIPRSGSGPRISELLGFLKRKLPAYMVPAAFIPMEHWPLTPAGKLDRQSLPAPGPGRPELEQELVPPRTPLEEALASIWREVLGLDCLGVLDNFFDLGGHSLLAIQVISRVRAVLKVELPLASIFAFPTIASLAEHLVEVTPSAQPVLPISVAGKGRQLPLTSGQRRLWFLDQFEPRQSSYNIPSALRLEGGLDVEALERSLTELSRRHEALRTMFPAEDGVPVQYICEPKPVALPIVDLRPEPSTERPARLKHLLAQEARRSYVMSSPMLRPVLFRIEDDESVLLLLTHHLASDAHSVHILVRELTQLYEATVGGSPSPLPPLRFSYSELVGIRRLSAEAEIEQVEYWKRRLDGAPPLLELPTDHPRPVHQSDEGASQLIAISPAVCAELERLVASKGATLFMGLLATFQVLLSRYSGATDMVVGTVLPNRDADDMQGVIGRFQNFAALRCDLSGNPTFSEVLERVRRVTLGAEANRLVAFARVVEELQPTRNAAYTPIFQVLFELDEELLPETTAGGLRFTPFKVDNYTSKLDLALHLERSPRGLGGWLEFNSKLFDPPRIARMVGHFQTLLESAVRHPEADIGSLPLLPEQELQRLEEWSGTEQSYPPDATIPQLFEAQAAQRLDTTALICGQERFAYRDLNESANQVARYLVGLGAGPGTAIGVCLERSWRLLSAILGVLKAGGAYVPLDPAYPRERLQFILEDVRAPILLTQESLRGLYSSFGGRTVSLDGDWERIRSQSRENAAINARSSDLAYVIYTSGSTGRPKGVAIEHRSAVAFLHWAASVFSREDLDGVLASTSICFDLSIFEIFAPLSWGGKIILARNALELPSLPAGREVKLINTVPSAMRELLRARAVPPSVRIINLAGERLPTSLVDQIYGETGVEKVYDLYGPTETTTYSTFALRRPDQPPTIGRPLANQRVLLLDNHFQPVPVGVPGEIFIGGSGLARGYLNQPELTAEKFVPDPGRRGARLYRTGDLARWREDGQLEYLGRRDDQVKVRGFRIELGEIESALRRNAALSEAVVVAREDQPGDKRLVAYAVCRSAERPSPNVLRQCLEKTLPAYMLPAAYVFLEALPLTPNGKVDRKALPAPEPARVASTVEFIAPRTSVEEQLAGIWRDVLRLEKVGVEDNFFELGGHSLLAIQVISRIRESFGVELPLFSLFDDPTIAALAAGLAEGRWTQDQLPVLPLARVPRRPHMPVSFVQERLWFLDQLEPGRHDYNVALAVRLSGALNAAAFQKALDELQARHEALRTVFLCPEGELFQSISAPRAFALEVDEAQGADLDTRRAAACSRWEAEARRPFDLARGPLARGLLLRVTADEHLFGVVMHHTISDGWSLATFFQELGLIYDALASGNVTAQVKPPDACDRSADALVREYEFAVRRGVSPHFFRGEGREVAEKGAGLTPPPSRTRASALLSAPGQLTGSKVAGLPELPIQYADFAHWRRQSVQGALLEEELTYWREQLAGAPESIQLPVHQGPSTTRRGRQVRIECSKDEAAAVAALCQSEGCTLFMALMSALAITLYKWTGQKDMVIGTVVAGRNRRELENVIGCFMNFLPIRVRLSGEESARQVLTAVRNIVLGAQTHQDCPFEKIVEAVNPERKLNQNPLYNVALLLQNLPRQLLASHQLRSELLPTETDTALLDLRFEAEQIGGGLSLLCEYRTDLFDAATIEALLDSFRTLLQTLAEAPATPISAMALTSNIEHPTSNIQHPTPDIEHPTSSIEPSTPRIERPPSPIHHPSSTIHHPPSDRAITIAATFTAEPLEEPLCYWLEELHLDASISFASYNQVFQQLLDPSSPVCRNTRGLNIVLVRMEDWDSEKSGESALERNVRELTTALRAAVERGTAPCLLCVCPPSPEVADDEPRRNRFAQMETLLASETRDVAGVWFTGTAELAALYPVAEYHDAAGLELGGVPYTEAFFAALSTLVARRFHALSGPPVKVMALDCDQTLWKGVCGEDGPSGICLDPPHAALQQFVLSQREAGRLLVLCSKNNPEDVLEVFARNPQMPLRIEHFSGRRLNWQPKSENLKSLASELGLGLESFVFLDDNPLECAEVQAQCPEVLAIQLPEPERIPEFLRHCWVFDPPKTTEEDRRRAELYQANRRREQERAQAVTLADFIAGLELRVRIAPMDPNQLPRVAQLTQRTNQFNCTTRRRAEPELRQLATTHDVLTVEVSDRFGDYGLVGVMICRTERDALATETFLLSCRALGRGVEHRMLAALGGLARERELAFVDIQFRTSPKNRPALDFLESGGAQFCPAPLEDGARVARLPATLALNATFNPSADATPAAPSALPSASGPTRKFGQCRAIAMAGGDINRILGAMRKRARVRQGSTAGYQPPRTDQERQLCALWEGLLHVERVGIHDNFFELGGHSLLAVRLFSNIEKLTGRKHPLVTLFRAPTIAELARILGEDQSAPSQSPLVPIQPRGSKPPLFLVHGAGGDVLWGYANLAAHTSPDQPIYGIKSRGQLGLEEFERLQDTAAYYLEAIRRFQPSGPYFLGGYCLGGNVAYEMARQLRQQGETVGFVALLDSAPANAGYERVAWWRPGFALRFARNLRFWLADFSALAPGERWRFIWRKSRALGRKLLRRIHGGGHSATVDLEDVIDPAHFPQNELRLWRIHLQALEDHVEQPYDGPVDLFRTRGQPLLCSFEEDFCWGSLVTGGVTITHIPGSHENIFMESNVRFLARVLQTRLDQAIAETTPGRDLFSVHTHEKSVLPSSAAADGATAMIGGGNDASGSMPSGRSPARENSIARV